MRAFRQVSWTVMNRLLLVMAFGLAISSGAHEEDLQGPNSNEVCSIRDPLMDPTYEVLYGQDTVWQIPPRPKAVLFMAHGLGEDPFVHFDQSPKCEKCCGMPEERSIVLEALRRGYAVISVKSIGRSWDYENPESCEDLPIVVSILNDWRREHSLEGLPFSVFGMSAGGFFATILAVRVPTRALILMCSQGQTEVIENATREIFPPTFFVYMGIGNRTLITVDAVEESIAILIARAVRVESKYISPSPVTPLFFTERIPCVTNETSEKMQRAFKAEGWLNGDNYLMEEPRLRDWKAPLRKWNALPAIWDSDPDQFCSREPMAYELSRAYAQHSVTGDANDEMFSWMDSIVMSSYSQLTRPLSSSR